MVRQTIAIRGFPQDASSEISIKEEVVDIFHEEQFSEQYLCEINPEGQVMILPVNEAYRVLKAPAIGTSARKHTSRQANT